MLLAFSIIGIFLSVILVYFNARKYFSSVYLGLFFFLISVYSFTQYVLLYSKSVHLVAIIFINIGFLSYLIGPMFYIYFRSILTDTPKLKRTDILHLTPMLLFIAGIINYMVSPWPFKLQVAEKIVEDSTYLATFEGILLYQLIPSWIVFISRPVLILVYTCFSFGLLVRYLRRGDDHTVLRRQKFMTKWLFILTGFLTLLVLSHLFMMIHGTLKHSLIDFYTLNLTLFISGAGLVGLLIAPFFFPGILYGMPRMPVELLVVNTHHQKSAFLPSEKHKQATKFESEYLILIGKKVETCMEEQQPYLNTGFNMAQLSVLISVPAHHLAFYFREEKRKSFIDFRNEWRVDYAKTLIKKGKALGYTLEAIGLLSGFTNRNTFFKAFKKAEGVTPGAYLAQFAA